MICLMPKLSQKISGIIGVSLWPPNPDLNTLDHGAFLENKINATSHLNIGSLKTAIEGEWNKMFEEFILKACQSFQRNVEKIIEKNDDHIE